MRIFNFSAGPAVLPTPVLEKARDELLDWHGRGMSIMEMSHRGKDFTGVIESAEADLRTLMGIPSNYKVLFLQGGATQMFAQIPMNLLAGGSADYVVTGSWSKKAIKEAQRVGKARLAGSTEADAFTRLPWRPGEGRQKGRTWTTKQLCEYWGTTLQALPQTCVSTWVTAHCCRTWQQPPTSF